MSSILSVVCLTSLIAAAGNASGISGTWRETLQAGIAQQYAGHFAQAEALLRDALEESRRDGKNTETAETLNHLGGVYLSEDRFTDAEAAYSEAVSLYKQSSSAEIGAVVALRGLGAAFAFEGRDQQALSVLNQALRNAKTNFNSDTQLTAEILFRLGTTYFQQHSFKKAEALFLDVMRTKSADGVGNDLTTANALHNLALIHREQRKFTNAEKEFLDSLQIMDTLLGPSHPYAAITRSSLGLLYFRTGRLEEAQAQLVESLRITSQTNPVIPGRMVRILHMLGETYARQGKMTDSEELLAKAVEIARQRNLSRDPETIAVLNAYSAVLSRSGKAEEARNAQREADLLRATRSLTAPVRGLH